MPGQKPQPYFSTLGNAFQALFKEPAVLIPAIISFIWGLVSVVGMTYLLPRPLLTLFSLRFFLFLMVISMINFFIYGWQLSLIRQLVVKRKISIGASFQNALPLAWKMLKTGILLFLIATAMFIIMGIIIIIGGGAAILAGTISPLLGIVITILFSIIGLGVVMAFCILCLLYGFYSLQLIPVLIFDNLNARQTISRTYSYFKENLGASSKRGILSIVTMVISYLPFLIFIIITGSWLVQPQDIFGGLIAQLFTIPILLTSLAIVILYGLQYYKQK